MPAFGVIHSDEHLWHIVALLRRLPQLSPEEFAQLTEAPGAGEANEQTGTHHRH